MAKKGKKHIPSQKQLRVFEAAARHLSFKKAADELCVSPPAVSHQIRVLEDYLETKLFLRLNRRLLLTKEGQEYFSVVQSSLEDIELATNRLFLDKAKETFCINTIPLIANLLLMPQLRDLQKLMPNVNISVESQQENIDFDSEDADVAIRFQVNNEEKLMYEPLFPVHITPICGTKFLAQLEPEQLKTLKDVTLIRLTADRYSWPLWLKQWQIDIDIDQHSQINVNSFQAALEGARNGLGLMMGYFPPTQVLIKDGAFSAPFAEQYSSLGQVYLVYRIKDQQSPLIQCFSQWLKNLIAAKFSDNIFLSDPS